ncbi:MAG: D-sedoheptulose 7-phosphate isomerase [Dehalococcoidia bacterium]
MQLATETELTLDVMRQIEDGDLLRRALRQEASTLAALAQQMAQTLRRRNQVVLFGNGGSAADAQHIAAELVGRCQMERAPLAAIALTTDTSILTAVANDYGYEEVFARQVRALVQPGDVVVGISTSGNSPNVIRGIEEARRLGAVTVAFTGEGGELRRRCDYVLAVPSREAARIQEVHITAGHIVCILAERILFGGGNG